MARWEEALDAVVDTWRFWCSAIGKQYGDGYARSLTADKGPTADRRAAQYAMKTGRPASDWAPGVSTADGKAMGAKLTHQIARDIAGTLAQACLTAEPIYVDPEMGLLIDASAKTWQPEPLLASDLITPSGFMVLPRPIVLSDVWDKSVSFRAIQWYPLEIDTGKNLLNGQTESSHGILLALYHGTGTAADRDDYDESWPYAITKPPFILAHYTVWMFNWTAEGDMDMFFDAAKYLQVALRLMQQHIAVRTQSSPSAPFRGRAEKAQHPARKITVVTLRRPKAATDHEPTGVDWAQRWIVSGHWRNQWYPSLSVHRQRWIGGYVKGPGDKPLVIRPGRVFELVR